MNSVGCTCVIFALMLALTASLPLQKLQSTIKSESNQNHAGALLEASVEKTSVQDFLTDNPLLDSPEHIIAYFRHSIKAATKANVGLAHILKENMPGVTPGPSTLFTKCFLGADGQLHLEKEYKHPACIPWLEDLFGTYDAELTGNGKTCPYHIGKMLATRLGSADATASTSYNLWASPYHRVLGTGLQMLNGAMGAQSMENSFPQRSVGNQAATQNVLLGLINEVGGQVTPWMAEYIRHFALPADSKQCTSATSCDAPVAPERSPVDDEAARLAVQGQPEDYFKVVSQTGAEFPKFRPEPGLGYALGDGFSMMQSCYSTPVYKAGYETNQPAVEAAAPVVQDLYEMEGHAAQQFEVQTDSDIRVILAQMMTPDGSDMLPEFGFLKSPTEYYAKQYPGEEAVVTYDYAKLICRVGQLFLNERASMAAAGADIPQSHKEYIPQCDESRPESNEDKCNDIVETLDNICWPIFGKDHNIGKSYGMIDASVVMLLGALAKRAGLLDSSANDLYNSMLAKSNFNPSVWESKHLDDDPRVSVRDPSDSFTAGSGGKSVVLMSSHDATTNALRIMMTEAGLTVKDTMHRSDADLAPMSTPNQLSYDVMFTFEMARSDGAWKLNVRNYVASLKQLRGGCESSEYAHTTSAWTGSLNEFLQKMTDNMLAKDADGGTRSNLGINTIPTIAKQFLQTLKIAIP